MIAKFLADERGATAIEYAMIAAFLSVAIVPVVAILAVKLVNNYELVAAIFD